MRKMKDSGTVWLGSIPMCWEIGRIDSYYTLRNTKVSDKDYPPLSVTMKGVLPQLETAAKTNAHDDRKLVKKGDFAINSRSDRRGSCGISIYDGSVSLINTILAPKGEMHPKYYDWLFHTVQFADEFFKWGHGIVDDLWTTTYQDMKKINIPVPPFVEQQSIADFLDTKCAEIDALIADIQAGIESLEAYKRSVITEIVTKGIDKDAPMKNSGNEWVGAIPVNWVVTKLKYISRSIYKGSGITKEDVVENGDTPCVRYGEIYTKYNFVFNNCITRTNKQKISPRRYFSYGDILFVLTGEKIEEIGKNIAYLGNSKCLAGGDILIANHNQNPIFLTYALNSNYAQSQKSYDKTKLKVVHISSADIENLMVILPPLSEQQAIADYLDTKCAEIDTIIAQKQEQLAVLTDYKKSIIYEYVTGKKEVPTP